MIYGVDLGMRSLYIYGDDMLTCLTVDMSDRYHEIHRLAELVAVMFPSDDDMVFYEEPVFAGPKNIRTMIGLAQSSAALLAGSSARCYEVPVASWKKEIVGKGNAKKQEVSDWMYLNDPDCYELCAGDQNYIDAACIRKYGIAVIDRLYSGV